jgi:SNF2 family DNA or RNA helicase
MKKYKFKTKPFDHQMKALRDSWHKEYYALFMEMGTGKSKVAIDTMGALYTEGKINAALIISPKGVYDNWVQGEIPTHLSDEIETNIVRWQPSSAQWFQKQMTTLVFEKFNGLKIFVMNTEALSTPRGGRAAFNFLEANDQNIVIVDESTSIKNRSANRTQNIMSLKGLSKYRRILTGSPVTRSPMDLYSQCMFLSVQALKFKSFFAFQNRYALVQKRTMGPRSFNEIVGYRRLDELNQKLERFSNRVLKEDCLDLPDKMYVRRLVPLSEEQNKSYKEMKRLALTKLHNGELATTQSVLTQIMRLQQICCGHIQDDEGNLVSFANGRLKELLDICEEVQGKAIIWATFTYDIQQIAKALRDRFGPDSVATYYGETPQEERQEIVQRYQDLEDPLRFFVGQPKTGGYGITLTAANTVIYYSNSYDLEIRLQSEDRAHRIGQTNKVTYVDIISPDTVDEKILKALKEKINLAQQVLGEDVRSWLS